MFRSSLAIALGGTAAAVGPALSEVVPQPEFRSALVGLLTALCIAIGDALMRRYRARHPKVSRGTRRRNTRRNSAAVKPTKSPENGAP